MPAATLSPLIAAAERQLADLRAARSHATPGALANWLTGGAELQAPHLAMIDRAWQAVADGTERRVLITMPPRHGKTRRASRWGPLWYLRRFPDRRVVVASYAAELADEHGRWVRDMVEAYSGKNGEPDLGLRLNPSSSAANRWDLVTRPGAEGGMRTVGVGGGLTGRGAHVLVIDDPVKDREAADSQAYRKHLWEWYTEVARTRLEPGGAMLLIQCMTGDTPVLLPDGTQRPLADVRPGDMVATYDAGRLATRRVLNWADQGPDRVFRIRMRSGVEVRANARHPFLTIEGGVEAWRRTDELRPGSVIRRATGGSGEASPVPLTAATSPRSAGACACRTTTRLDGRADTARRPSTPSRDGLPTSSTATASPASSTTSCLPSRATAARSAAGATMRPASPDTGSPRSASITTTTPAACEGCYAATATSPSASGEPRPSCAPPLSTWTVGEDVVVEVISTGTERVYDLQIEGTENFIANGLVSHNTRWHEDDLAGRLLAEQPEKWLHLNLPAVAEPADLQHGRGDDLLGREIGDPLRPARYDAESLKEMRVDVGERGWAALYQQRPAPLEGGLFKRAWFDENRRRGYIPGEIPKLRLTMVGVDPSGSEHGAETGIVVAALGMDDHGYVLADESRRGSPMDRYKAAWLACLDHQAGGLVVERNYGGDNVIAALHAAWDALVREDHPKSRDRAMPSIVLVDARSGKLTRAEPVAVMYETGRIHHVGALETLEQQMLLYNGTGDSPDRMDAVVWVLTYLLEKRVAGSRGGTVRDARLAGRR